MINAHHYRVKVDYVGSNAVLYFSPDEVTACDRKLSIQTDVDHRPVGAFTKSSGGQNSSSNLLAGAFLGDVQFILGLLGAYHWAHRCRISGGESYLWFLSNFFCP